AAGQAQGRERDGARRDGRARRGRRRARGAPRGSPRRRLRTSMTRTRAQWLADEPFTLALGAGFFGFFAQTGLLAALEDEGLRPARVVGVSAGALAGGLWASGLSAADLEAELCSLRREDFWDPGLPLFGLL